MKRVLFVISSSEVGGAQKWLNDQVALLENSIEIYVVSSDRGWLGDRVRNYPNVKFIVIPGLNKYVMPLAFLRLRRLVNSYRIDCVVASSASAGVYARLLKLICRLKVIYVSHGWSALYNFGRWSWLGARLEQFLSYLSDAIICVSTSDFELASHTIGIKNSKLIQISNGVFQPDCKESHSDGLNYRFLTVSRLEHPKRIDLAIRATLMTNFELTIVGGGSQLEKLKKLAGESTQIKFSGEIRGFKDFNKYDGFLLISDSEGLPLSAVEAMSFGMPLILSRVGGCPELVVENGFLVGGSVEEISNAMREVARQHEILSSNSKKLFLEQFCLERKIDEYLDVYKY